jgi:hypothetical protein
MAKRRISDLPLKDIPDRDDLLAIVDQQEVAPTTKKTTLGRVLDILNALVWANRGAPNGVASLDSSGKVPVTQIPTAALNTGATGARGVTGATGATGSQGPLPAQPDLKGQKASLAPQGPRDSSAPPVCRARPDRRARRDRKVRRV